MTIVAKRVFIRAFWYGKNQTDFRRLSSSMMCLLVFSCRTASAWYPAACNGVLRTRRCFVSTSKTPYRDTYPFYSTEKGAKSVDSDPTASHHIITLTEQIRQAYEEGETDAILKLAKTVSLDSQDPIDLISASAEAVNYNKGQVAGIVNSWIGACCEMEDPVEGAATSLKLLEAYETLADDLAIYPDLVTFSLAYTALSGTNQEGYQRVADSVLERASKLSKKKGGSKRRKALAAARRKGPAVLCKAVQDELQELFGPDFQVLEETNDLLVLSKPSGVVLYHKHTTTAGKRKKGGKTKGRNKEKVSSDVSLEDALLSQNVQLSTLNSEGRGFVHRIDRGTSGCIVLAKTDEMHAKLLTQFFLRRVKKSYTAIVSPAGDDLAPEGSITVPVDGRPAKSVCSVMERFGNFAARLKVETFTGRKHQVRVHCARGLERPILLDPLYGNENDTDSRLSEAVSNLTNGNQQKFFLHASTLVIPECGVDVEAPLPLWWKDAISEFKTQLQ